MPGRRSSQAPLVEAGDPKPDSRARSSRANTRKWQVAKVGLSTLALLGAGLMLLRNLGGTTPGDASRSRVLVDALTGDVFRDFRVREGTSMPWRNPKAGGNTLYPAEPCFWTKDGKAKIEPTYVFVKSYAGESGDSICPDCGRKVVPHNPPPPDALMLEALRAAGK